MIGRLKGTVDFLDENSALIDVGGVGYQVHLSARNLAKLQLSQAADLWIQTIVREDSIALYGFFQRAEQDWFNRLTTVQGIGNKVAMAILGAMDIDRLALAIMAEDPKAFSKVGGVGPKLSVRIITELKGKVVRLPAKPGVDGSAATAQSSEVDDVVSALANLGYQRTDAVRAAMVAVKNSPDSDISALIVAALKELGK